MKKTTFLLFAFLASCLLTYAAVIPISPGTKTIYDALASASAGDILELSDGIYNETSNVIVDKSITIRNANATAPVIKVNRFSVRANFTLQGVTFDGNSTATEGIRIDGGQNLIIKILDTEIRNFTSRAINFYATSKTVAFVDTLIVDGCKFQNTLRALNATVALEQFKHLEIKNSTFYKLDKDGYFINISPGEELVSGAKVIVDHCTFYNCFSRRGVYIANLDNAQVTNNIAYYSNVVNDTKSIATYGSNSIVRNNISFNVELYGNAPRQNIILKNPLFVDAENGNLQLYANSPAIGAGDNVSNLGDPHWGVSTKDAPLGAVPYNPFKKPYSMAPTENSVRILWQMLDTISTGVVYYGKTEALGDSIVSRGGRLVPEEGFVHVKEITGLDPFTTYYFQVGDGFRKFEEIQKTKTAAAKGTATRFAIASDFHDNSGNVWQNMVSPILNQKPDLFIHLGDIVNYGDMRPWNASFFTPSEPLLNQIPIIGAVGNHETGDKKSDDGPSTYYDYFSSPSHGYVDGSNAIDPRGESYYAMNYGNVKIISLNINGDKSSPSFEKDSKQLLWLDEQMENSDSKWIFIIAHVSVYSTGYHGQWSANQKQYVAPILEKHAANGKHVIFFSGNCHSFEHLYKSGVHYVRPSVAASNIREQFNLADLPYSLIWKSINGFSTIDVSEDGETVNMISRDKNGEEFYSYEFTRTAKMLPSLYFTEPDGNNDAVTDVYRIKWTCFDETGNGKINLYHSLDSINGTLIAENLSTDLSQIDDFDWNVRYLEPKGDYFIYGTIDDGINPPVRKYAKGKISVLADTTPPPAPTSFTGALSTGQIELSWLNPTRLMNVENMIDDFENGISRFTGIPYEQTATGSLEMVPGYNGGNALQVNYNVLIPWGQYSAETKCSKAQNFSETPYLEFWFKGDGSSRVLRVMITQDLDFNGVADDWWYNESISLSSTEWKKIKLDIRDFGPFSWHPNVSKALDPSNIFSLEYIIPSGTVGGGSILLDSIVLKGQIYPAPDFEGTKIVRRTDRFATTHIDGDVVYNGINESFTDTDIQAGTEYYYAGFTYDDLNNYSQFNSSASWHQVYTHLKTSNVNDILQVYPNPANSFTNIRYTVPTSSNTSLYLEDITGRRIKEIASNQTAGNYQHSLDTKELASGVYFIKIIVDNQMFTTKIIINK